MNPYNFSLLFLAFGGLLLGLLVFLKRRDYVGRIYFLFMLVVAIWGCSFSVVLSNNVTEGVALMAARIAHGNGVFIAVTWYHFVLVLVGKVRARKKLLIGLYVFSFLVLPFMPTDFFVPRVEPILGFSYYTRTGIILDIAMFLYCAQVILAFIELAIGINRCTVADDKTRLKGFFIATFVGFLGGSLTILPVYEIPLPQYCIFLTPFYPFVTAYFMVRHHLFDVDDVIEAFQREKLASLGLMAASINHEIRNPLYIVKELLKSQIEFEKEGIQKKDPIEVAQKALAQTDRALEVVRKLSYFTRPTAQTEVTDSASVPRAVETVIGFAAHELKEENIAIRNELESHVPHVKADQRQLEEIFFNLIINACHAMSQGGELHISANHKNGRLFVTISDTGVGMGAKQLKNIFKPFYTTKTKTGTGLGLYITKELVERNYGTIQVHSEEGQGTRFILAFRTL
jgi:signal transduction histidine kinase